MNIFTISLVVFNTDDLRIYFLQLTMKRLIFDSFRLKSFPRYELGVGTLQKKVSCFYSTETGAQKMEEHVSDILGFYTEKFQISLISPQ